MMSLFKQKEPIEKSSLLFSSNDLLKLIVPLVLQQVLSVAVGTVDSMMVAYTGEAAVSGVSLINTLDTLLIIFFTAMVSGGSVVIAQALGKKRDNDVREAAKQLLYFTVILAVILTTAVLLLRRPLLRLLFGDVEADVMSQALSYFFFVALSFPLHAINSSVGACFRSAGNSALSLSVTMLINLFNLGGNALLIIGLDMGAAGAGLATLIARLIGSLIYLVLIHQKKHPVHVERLLHYKPNFSIIREILHIGVPNGIENTMFQFGRLLTQSLISTMGTAVIAANAVALTLSNFQYMTGTACSAAMITVVGRCIGAKEERQAKYYSRKILFINYGLLWTVILGTLLFLRPLVSVYDLSDASSELAQTLIVRHAILAALIWPLGFMLPSAFRAASDVRFSMVVSSFSMWLFRVAGAYLLALDTVSVFGLLSVPGFGLGIIGVWTAMLIDWLFRCPTFLVHYLNGKRLRAKRKKE